MSDNNIPKNKILREFYKLSKEDVLRLLGSSINGISREEAETWLARVGKNVLAESRERGPLAVFWGQFNNFLSYLILAAAVITFILKDYTDSAFIMVVLLINAVVGFYQEYKASNILKELKKYVKYDVHVLRSGREQIIDSSLLVPGDIIFLRGGERVPADARILESHNLFVDESILSGESFPVDKIMEPIRQDVNYLDWKNSVFLGTFVVSGRGMAVATNTGKDSQFGKIISSLQSIEQSETPLQKKISSLSHLLGFTVMALAGLVVLLGFLQGRSMYEVFIAAVALAVSSIPEGLLPAITVVLVLGMKRILKKKGLVKRLAATETLGGVTVICTDKTGTLTEGKMRLSRIIAGREELLEVDRGYSDARRTASGEEIFALKVSTMASGAFIENPDEDPQDWKMFGSPTEQAVIVAAMHSGIDKRDLDRENREIDFLAFDEKRKFAVSQREKDGTHHNFILGVPEIILNQASFLYGADANIPLSDEQRKKIIGKLEDLTRTGLRVLGCSYKTFGFVPSGASKAENIQASVFVGFLAFRDPLRKDVIATFQETVNAGVKLVVMSGDHPLTVSAIMREMGVVLKREKIIIGEELKDMSDIQILDRIRLGTGFARVMPDQKLRVVKILKESGEVVAMIGDGVNDAPAIKASDVGVAVGSGTDIAKEASDIILLDNSLSILVNAIEEGRIIFSNIRRLFIFLVSDIFSEATLFLGAMLLNQPLPLLPAQILWINIVEDALPVIALSFEGKEPHIMKKPPRNPKDPLLDREMKTFFIFTAAILSFSAFGFFMLMRYFSSWPLEEIRTGVFVLMSMDSLLLTFSIRDYKKSMIRKDIFSNHFLTASLIISFCLLLLAIYVPMLNVFLNTLALNTSHMLFLIGIAIAEILIIDMIKIKIFNKKIKSQ